MSRRETFKNVAGTLGLLGFAAVVAGLWIRFGTGVGLFVLGVVLLWMAAAASRLSDREELRQGEHTRDS